MIKIRRGLDVPIIGEAEEQIHEGNPIRSVAVLGADYVGMKPTMVVKVGDQVKKGQLLFMDKKTEGLRFTSPAGGVVAAINRGEKRVLQSVVIDIAETEEEETFALYDEDALKGLTREQVSDNLLSSGLWTALRARPYSHVAKPNTVPHSIFVNAMDTNPLAANPEIVISLHKNAFDQGLQTLSKLTDGTVFVCAAEGSQINSSAEQIVQKEFSGPHPAGLVGTHIHFLDPVSDKKTVWAISYQDVIAVGKLFTSGKLFTDRVVALVGPQVKSPQLVKARLGASLDDLTTDKLSACPNGQANRIISGSVLNGRTARTTVNYLGRYHQQVSVLLEGTIREFMGWMSPGFEKHSVLGIYISSLFKNKKFAYNTNTNGSERAIVPVGSYEKVMPLDILPTHLLRSLIVGDTEMAQQLGCLELEEEDLALCSYVCPGKYEFGPILRDNLTLIEKEG